jgi:uncharacterized membrane protein
LTAQPDAPRASGSAIGVPDDSAGQATNSAARRLLAKAHGSVTALATVITRPHVRPVAALAFAVAALQAALGLQQFRNFNIGGYDLVIFDQAIRNYAHGGAPVSMFKNVHDAAQVSPAFTGTFSILGDHFSPILAVLAPLYWIWNDPQVLLLAQAALFGLAVPSVWVFARRALLRVATPRSAAVGAYLATIAFGLFWPLQEATVAGFHEVAFFVPLTAILIERYQAGRLRHMVICAIVLLTVKEDCGYIVAAFGLLLILTRRVNGERLGRAARRRYRIAGLCLAVGGLAFAQLVLDVWIPAFGGTPGFYWYYAQLGPDMAGALKTIVTDPAYAFHVATQPGIKVHTAFFLFWPFLYLSIASPVVLLAVPLLAERAFSDKPEHWGPDQHYNAFLAAILIMAAVDGLVRVLGLAGRVRVRIGNLRWRAGPRALRWAATAWAGATVLFAVVIIHTFPMASVFSPGGWQASPLTSSEQAAVSVIPSGVCVEADNDIAPHLSSRDQVILLDEVPRGCPWVVLQTVYPSYPLSSMQLAAQRGNWLAHNGYRLVFSQNEVFVYYRPTPDG